MKLQIFVINKFLRKIRSLEVNSLDPALKKDENYCPQVFLKEVKYINKVAIRHINDNLSDSFILLMSLKKNKFKLILFLKS